MSCSRLRNKLKLCLRDICVLLGEKLSFLNECLSEGFILTQTTVFSHLTLFLLAHKQQQKTYNTYSSTSAQKKYEQSQVWPN